MGGVGDGGECKGIRNYKLGVSILAYTTQMARRLHSMVHFHAVGGFEAKR